MSTTSVYGEKAPAAPAAPREGAKWLRGLGGQARLLIRSLRGALDSAASRRALLALTVTAALCYYAALLFLLLWP